MDLPTKKKSAIAFGSCNRQNKPQSHWSTIQEHSPENFLWLGDAVYSKGNTLAKLQAAYQNLTVDPAYLEFTEHVYVDGVWDDHDYGVNDGGKFVQNKNERRAEFLKFLHQSGNDIVNLPSDGGIYHSVELALGDVKAKVIFLDTRSFRDHHLLRSMGEQTFKGSAVIASFIRGAYSTLGIGRDYAGEVLGENQWAWFEQELLDSKAAGIDVNIVVSSIQVLTSNPIFESWGHFPAEKQRLFKLLQTVDPNNLVFLSGDVHLGEISEASYTRADGSTGKWTEVTSSGLTHSCSDGITGFLCPIMTGIMAQHRRSADSIYLHRNYGLLEISKLDPVAAPSQYLLNFTIRAVETSQVVLSHVMVVDRAATSAHAAPIVSVQYADYMQIPPAVTALLVCLLVALLYWCRKVACKPSRAKKVV